jgi:hypothetical protein
METKKKTVESIVVASKPAGGFDDEEEKRLAAIAGDVYLPRRKRREATIRLNHILAIRFTAETVQ